MTAPFDNRGIEVRSNLTPGQLLIWAGEEKTPSMPLYNMALNFRIDAELDFGAFKLAFQSVVDRCDSMRTVFDVVNGIPQRVVQESVEASIEYLDVAEETTPLSTAQRWTQVRCQRVFDLASVLFDTAVLRLSDSQFIWFFNQHHLVTDASSFGLIYRMVATEYGRLLAGQPLSAVSTPQFEDYASALQRAKKSDAAVSYWKQQLAKAPSRPRLYGEASRSDCSRTERIGCSLTDTQTHALQKLIDQPNFRMLTPHMTRCAVIATALLAYIYRVTGQRELTIGLPAHNRPSLDLKQTAGLFIEVFPMQAGVGPNETFESLYRKVQSETMSLLRFAQAGCCEPELHNTVSVVLNYITAAFGKFGDAPMQSEWLHSGHGDPGHNFRLQVQDFDDAGTLQLHFDFSSSLFDETTRAHAVGHFMRLLAAMFEDPTQELDAVDLLSDTERASLLATPDPGEIESTTTLYELFEQQARATPELVAIECGSDHFTYNETHQSIDHVAAELDAQGVRAGNIVALCMKRSPELIVSMLATTKLGAVWVPLDPAHPVQRLQVILDDATPVLTLVKDDSIDRLPQGTRSLTVSCQRLDSEHLPTPRYQPVADDPAYILYTSGSTGRPKGVVVPHRGIVNYVRWARSKYAGSRRLAFPFFSPITFDLTLTSIFVPLVSGGRVLVYSERGSDAELAILEVVNDNRVDIIKLTPSHLAMLQGMNFSQSRLRQLILGGENLRRDVADWVVQAIGHDVLLHNEYGPTEASVGCVLHTFDRQTDTATSIPIGRPIEGMSAWVLNENLVPCPAGVPGELFLAGAGLAVGYHNRPDLTKERFVEAPFAPGTIMYRTGDLARAGANGVIEYLGRRDQQVKVRGVRIETGEVEAALLRHENVMACFVHTHQTSSTLDAGVSYCRSCGLPSNYPDARFDADGVCNQCTAFAKWEEKASGYFKSMSDLRSVFESSNHRGEYDCLALLSGGKDSTYALAQLVEMGVNALAFTLDNGYISQGAKDNINRVVEALGVDHVYGSTPAMNAIFVDSLKRHANVCNGCFKTIYTLSLQLAQAKKIPFVVTGLSRGQFFETRLTEELFAADSIDVERIDKTILDARKAYHRVDDAVSQLMDVSTIQQDRIFEEVRFLDFYRYCSVELEEMLSYLDSRLPWIRPGDTGRSTNCLINDVGIHFHKKRRGFHNYAFPYAWDVRMGHKTRDAALEELDDEIDEQNVLQILDEIGFDEPIEEPIEEPREDRLVAWYSSNSTISTKEMRLHLQQTLPRFMIPTHFVRIDQIPVTANGKVDRDQLPAPQSNRSDESEAIVAPSTRNERILADIWSEVLGASEVGVCDHFIDLGGDSISAIQIVGRANRAGLLITIDQLFATDCIQSLARVARESARLTAEQGLVTGDVPLTPIQHWFFDQELTNPNHWNQSLLLETVDEIDETELEAVFQELINHHDALRLRFQQNEDGRWTSEISASVTGPIVRTADLPNITDDERKRRVDEIKSETHAELDIKTGNLIRVVLLRSAPGSLLLIVIHHLAMDAMSWPILLEDLDNIIQHQQRAESIESTNLPRKTTSFRRWSDFLSEHAKSTTPNVAIFKNPTGQEHSLILADTDTTAQQDPTVTLTISSAETRQLLDCASQTFRVRMHELLISVLCRCLTNWTQNNAVQLDIETHGREPLTDECDTSRTVGWFTAIAPLAANISSRDSVADTVRQIHSRLDSVPLNGIEFGLARYLRNQSEHRLTGSASDVLFNYLGAMEELLPQTGCLRFYEPLQLSRGDNRSRSYVIEVNTMLVRGKLRVDFTYCPKHLKHTTVTRLAEDFVNQLRTVKDEGIAQPSAIGKFPSASLNKRELGKLANILKQVDGQRGPNDS